VVDAIAAGSSGFLIDSGDYRGMVEVLADLHYSEETSAACRAHASHFSWNMFGDKFLAHLRRAVNEG
jgi:glycosyltransferase involved in cell wall biosynthesis